MKSSAFLRKMLLASFIPLLSACLHSPTSYLPKGQRPIINIEAELANQIEVSAEENLLSLKNIVPTTLGVNYKIIWYDKNGVTQTFDGPSQSSWALLWLTPQEKRSLALLKPTPESINYRFYIKPNKQLYY